MKIGEQQKLDIVKRYQNLDRMTELANAYGVTRGRIWQILKEAGIDTAKRRLEVSCRVCGTVVSRTKAHVRKNKHHYCTVDCYYASLENRQSRYWRHGQRMARAVVAQVFDLLPGHVVHHIDGNNYHNELSNLMVFACAGDHVRFHRGFDSWPIWPSLPPG